MNFFLSFILYFLFSTIILIVLWYTQKVHRLHKNRACYKKRDVIVAVYFSILSEQQQPKMTCALEGVS